MTSSIDSGWSRTVKRLRVLAAPFCLALCLAVTDAAAVDAPAERAWWAFRQRAYPLGHIPAGAQIRALSQTRASQAISSRAAGRAAVADSDRWINIGPAPILAPRPYSGRVASIAVDPGVGGKPIDCRKRRRGVEQQR
jgi:hypothetical protein